MTDDERPGPDIPGFTWLRRLGRGGFSDVHLYREQSLRREVAIKVLSPDLDDEALAALEANLMAQFDTYPLIGTVYSVGTVADGRPYIVMPYYSGGSLGSVTRAQPLDVREALRVGIQVASALETAHVRGILHRDVKPANILRNGSMIVLSDFGISTRVESSFPHHTETRRLLPIGGAAPGFSLPWTPPEVIDETDADHRADIFSLAATVYTLIAGHSPFQVPDATNSSPQVSGRIHQGAITPFADHVPPRLVEVLTKALSTAPADRHASAFEFAQELQEVERIAGYPATDILIDLPDLVVPRHPAAEADHTEVRVDGRTADPTELRPGGPTELRPGGPPVLPKVVPPVDADERLEDTAPKPLPPAPEPVERPRRRGLVVRVVAIAALAAVLVAIIVAAVLNASRAGADDPASDAPSEGESGVMIDGAIADPVLEGKAFGPDGTTATFEWSNPDPREGDEFLWRRSEPGTADTSAEDDVDGIIAIEGLTPGALVCIEVVLVRDGKDSGEPVEECLP